MHLNVAAAFFGWYLNKGSRRRQLNYLRREVLREVVFSLGLMWMYHELDVSYYRSATSGRRANTSELFTMWTRPEGGANEDAALTTCLGLCTVAFRL